MTRALEGGEGSASRPGRTLPPGKNRYPLYRRLGGPHGRSGQVRENPPPTGIVSRDRPARSQSLYRLSYPAHTAGRAAEELEFDSRRGKRIFLHSTAPRPLFGPHPKVSEFLPREGGSPGTASMSESICYSYRIIPHNIFIMCWHYLPACNTCVHKWNSC